MKTDHQDQQNQQNQHKEIASKLNWQQRLEIMARDFDSIQSNKAINNVLREAENRRKLIKLLEESYKTGKLTLQDNVITLEFKNEANRKIVTRIDATTGNWFNLTKRRMRKKRQYRLIHAYGKDILVPSYRFLFIALAILTDINKDQLEKYKNTDAVYDINHINGDHTDNRIENLEVCTRTYNTIHAKLMRTLLSTHPDLVESVAIKNKDGKVISKFIRYKDKKGVSAQLLEQYNNYIEDDLQLKDQFYLDNGLYLHGEPIQDKRTLDGQRELTLQIDELLDLLEIGQAGEREQ